jgi:hypothetical protein
MRSLARLLGRLVLALGWVAFCLLAVLFLAEKSELLTLVVRRVLADRVGPLGKDLYIEHASLGWFLPAVQLRGTRLGEGGDMVRLAEVRLSVDLSAGGGLRVSRVDVSGGHVRLSQDLFDRLRTWADSLPPRLPGARHTAAVPSITVRNVELDLDTKRLGRLPLGTVDVAVRIVPSGGPVLTGRLVPSLSSAPGGSGEIVLAGQESEPGSFDVSASAAGVPISTVYLPEGTDLDGLRPFAPHGILALKAQGVISLDTHIRPHGTARLALTEGGFVAPNRQPIEGIRIELETAYAPKNTQDLWSLGAWSASARASGRWREIPFEAVARLADADDSTPAPPSPEAPAVTPARLPLPRERGPLAPGQLAARRAGRVLPPARGRRSRAPARV